MWGCNPCGCSQDVFLHHCSYLNACTYLKDVIPIATTILMTYIKVRSIKRNVAMIDEMQVLSNLETRVTELLDICQRLRQDNAYLRAQYLTLKDKHQHAVLGMREMIQKLKQVETS